MLTYGPLLVEVAGSDGDDVMTVDCETASNRIHLLEGLCCVHHAVVYA
jgi:hypothetical protein